MDKVSSDDLKKMRELIKAKAPTKTPSEKRETPKHMPPPGIIPPSPYLRVKKPSIFQRFEKIWPKILAIGAGIIILLHMRRDQDTATQRSGHHPEQNTPRQEQVSTETHEKTSYQILDRRESHTTSQPESKTRVVYVQRQQPPPPPPHPDAHLRETLEKQRQQQIAAEKEMAARERAKRQQIATINKIIEQERAEMRRQEKEFKKLELERQKAEKEAKKALEKQNKKTNTKTETTNKSSKKNPPPPPRHPKPR